MSMNAGPLQQVATGCPRAMRWAGGGKMVRDSQREPGGAADLLASALMLGLSDLGEPPGR